MMSTSHLKNAMVKKCPTSVFIYPICIVRRNPIQQNYRNACEAHCYFYMFLLFDSLAIIVRRISASFQYNCAKNGKGLKIGTKEAYTT